MGEGDNASMRADRLATAADRILIDLDLMSRLAAAGRPVLVGSAAVKLMAVPDIDFSILCPGAPDTGAIFRIGQLVFDHPWVERAYVVDERGGFRSVPGPEFDGIYLGVRYYDGGTRAGIEWRIDCWFFPETLPRPDIAMLDRLLAASPEERAAILRIKHALLASGRYKRDVHGIDVYRAVLDGGVRTMAGFNRIIRM
jgi:hypothetical protein